MVFAGDEDVAPPTRMFAQAVMGGDGTEVLEIEVTVESLDVTGEEQKTSAGKPAALTHVCERESRLRPLATQSPISDLPSPISDLPRRLTNCDLRKAHAAKARNLSSTTPDNRLPSRAICQ